MMQAYAMVRSDGNFSWPSRARIAVVLTSEYEPEYEIKPLTGGQPNYRQMAEMRYEATRGIWRNFKNPRPARCPFDLFCQWSDRAEIPPERAGDRWGGP